jgi:hypothetical protein
MPAKSVRARTAWISAAIIGLALADRALAALLGAEPLLPGLGEGAGLLAFAFGHCDTLDGPVVTAARKALDTGNVKLVLPWVRKEDEAEIRHAFDHALAVRKLGAEAKTLADRHFFETLVRVHRAGEGAPYTGLKPAGLDFGPAVPAADRALIDGSIEKVARLLEEALHEGLHRHFHAAESRRNFDPDDVGAGRAYVDAYVPYVHYVERLWQDATGAAHEHHAGHAAHEH